MLWDKGSLEMVWRGGGMACVVFNAWAMGNGRL